jgi:radical SAM-linked protein
MRLRITFSKSGPLRYSGHLDLHTIWERTVRRAGLPLAYTQGFHPGPRLQLASALPLGIIGRAEIVDIWINDNTQPLEGRFKEVLQSAAPPGLVIVSIVEVDDRAPALQTMVVAAEYEITLLDPVARQTLEAKISSLLEAASLPRERRGKPYDLRPLIESLSLLPEDAGGPPRLHMRLASRQGATGRPEEVLDALGIAGGITRIERTCLVI